MPAKAPPAPTPVRFERRVQPSSIGHRFLPLLALVPAIALPWMAFAASWEPEQAWAALAVSTLLFCVFLGWLITGVPQGVFVGKDNSWSLSITQSLLWTCIILPAVVIAVVARLPYDDPLDITVDPQFAVLLGVPLAGFAGAATIATSKRHRKGEVQNLQEHQLAYAEKHLNALWKDYRKDLRDNGVTVPRRPPQMDLNAVVGRHLASGSPKFTVASAQRADDPSEPFGQYVADYLKQYSRGVLVHNLSPSEARPTDMFEGEEVGDGGSTNFGKVQFFLISVMAMVAYCLALWNLFEGSDSCDTVATAPCLTGLPALGDALPGILVTSLAGYLGLKGLPSTTTK